MNTDNKTQLNVMHIQSRGKTHTLFDRFFARGTASIVNIFYHQANSSIGPVTFGVLVRPPHRMIQELPFFTTIFNWKNETLNNAPYLALFA